MTSMLKRVDIAVLRLHQGRRRRQVQGRLSRSSTSRPTASATRPPVAASTTSRPSSTSYKQKIVDGKITVPTTVPDGRSWTTVRRRDAASRGRAPDRRARSERSTRDVRTAHRHGDTAVELRGITKRFPGVVANHDIDITVRRGTVHAIVGENGAGKSTLMKILYGMQQPDEGTIAIDGDAVQLPLAGRRDRRRHRHGAPALHAGRQPHRRWRTSCSAPSRQLRPASTSARPARRIKEISDALRARRRARTRWSRTSASATGSGSRSSRCSTAAPGS